MSAKTIRRGCYSASRFGRTATDGNAESGQRWIGSRPGWLKIQNAETIDETIKLGTGERETISLAVESNANLVLIDDRKARRAAIERGLNIAGTINILESASKRGFINLSEAFQKLQQTNFRIAPDLLTEILSNKS